ncbi:MAG: methane monooxygenase/ammonia monooxygenase subunit A [Mycobacterium sp.]|uniref:methane monooxygenase/ammonia monooxygenase subunit A n=1 Tax=Mycobacterium sp. TaxID=1785 RepID=UPI0026324A0E|nr:methane monooxygenase/ammonia monooxygenase subunit A [Mycobacterium sp.]MDI3313149.1 methane monooxygenase/ammonia monooxygenase subunit A [Mycobacterium sp.]
MTTTAEPTKPAPPDQAITIDSFPLLSRRWDWCLLAGAALLIAGAYHLNQMLFVGDWGFWADWKDRQYWPLLVPALGIIVPAAVQYIAWSQLRIPVGATLCAACLFLAVWISRWGSFHLWSHEPMNYTWAENFLLAGILLDVVHGLTRSYLMTSVFGGLMWGFFFWFFNFPALSPFLAPVDLHGSLMTVADTLGFHFTRTQTPEYLRIVEAGHLRALVSNITIVVSFFAGMMSAAVYWVGFLIGKYLAVWPVGRFFSLIND